jgi:Zn-finger protein
MGKAMLIIDMSKGWEVGKCKTCQFARGSDQCKLTDVLTDGTCRLNCFCPLKPVED